MIRSSNFEAGLSAAAPGLGMLVVQRVCASGDRILVRLGSAARSVGRSYRGLGPIMRSLSSLSTAKFADEGLLH